ncbi:BMP family ABC transporter substrate-binding protein [Desulforamulus aquiferis]|uniref:BMP family ABC transporter substrate-binding protein n=2 Tax=Desulforamulus aquiferis TaxID=1397668 RepID=A0AAW7ZA76_9FIRM|nr:BMP family ABC transporter substrate-binding protein [Desulforamulus aquiferis]MDO7785961.1 BMP family ABC transporter substrate-binding protein [Desulforamulus aquiferis]RYD02033.1 ABC transporter substrate-binding protein [Desulforamulus aquiferis]
MKLTLKRMLGLALALVMSIAVIGCGGGEQKAEEKKDAADEKLKIAFIYVGPIGDGGWTYAQDLGRIFLEKEVPGIETTYIESVPEGADSERVLTELAEKGNKIIFATSFGYMDAVIKVAQKYPDVKFLHCSGYKTAENAGTYFGRMYQARYLTGLMAGKETESNIIGYVAAFPIPEVIRGINAFTVGVREVNPEAKVKVVWTNTWYDPAAEKEAAKSLLEAGADVITQHQDTPGPMQAAEEKGKFGIGYNSDMASMAPKAVLTSAVWNWGPYYVDTVKAIQAGTWKSDQYWGPMSDGIVGLAPYGPMVSDEVKQLVEAKKQEILEGKWDVFTGPIKDQSGQEKVPAGQVMSDADMLSFDWFVEGVDGTIPK